MDSYLDEDLAYFEDIDTTTERLVIVENREIMPDTPVYRLRLLYSNETFAAAYNGEILRNRRMVIVPTRFGKDLAEVMGRVKGGMFSETAIIERIAGDEDLAKASHHKELEQNAFITAKEKIAAYRLDMKLVSVHYLLEDSKILFFFTAENRIDFRELVKDMGALFHARIEMRQIGIRDEARILGGLGVCGRGYCCCAISDKLKPVSIRMAKEQNLSLNSIKISGPCGRLLCCLAYEHNFYCEQRRLSPQEGMKITYNGEVWQVLEVNPIAAKIKIAMEDGRQVEVPIALCEKNGVHWRVKPSET
jgi:cell fate regulator YaaT (PSP1 superfamily)